MSCTTLYVCVCKGDVMHMVEMQLERSDIS